MQTMPLKIVLVLTIFSLSNPYSLLAAMEQRTALVIGNGSYSNGSLKNPVNDATDMASALKRLGFNVILKTNVRLRDMDSSIREFGRKLSKSDVGLFYFAGHGIQVSGVNYLIPVGANIEKEEDVRYEAIDAGRVLSEMAHANNGLNIVILDACRNNPFARSFRSESRGLAIIGHVPKGSFISYATSPGDLARDGEGRNSPYTKSLLQYMKQPGLPIEGVFKKVRQTLDAESGGKQIPWELSSLSGDFYFNPPKAGQEYHESSYTGGEERKTDKAPGGFAHVLTNSVTSDPGNTAQNAAMSRFPSPMESDSGWGGGSRQWQIVDGIRTYQSEWARGLAFTGGQKSWAEQVCGWRQATIDFGVTKNFNRVVLWHHGREHVPNACKVQYWNGQMWMDALSSDNCKDYLKYKTAQPQDWWDSWSTPMEIVFARINAAKVRFAFNNCDIEHGWLYEFEVYNDR
ncbi:MAG: caspase family protein [Syntrophales bacterium]